MLFVTDYYILYTFWNKQFFQVGWGLIVFYSVALAQQELFLHKHSLLFERCSQHGLAAGSTTSHPFNSPDAKIRFASIAFTI